MLFAHMEALTERSSSFFIEKFDAKSLIETTIH